MEVTQSLNPLKKNLKLRRGKLKTKRPPTNRNGSGSRMGRGRTGQGEIVFAYPDLIIVMYPNPNTVPGRFTGNRFR
ncbi:hypothetical protein Gogos_018122, partial [Gossypium gossypioides]|nr:hypothetical protein [Gossypium gossypioides]